MGNYDLRTKRGYSFYEVTSAMQKAIRRGDAKMAGYWAIELFESRFADYLWKRLYVISAEDCWGIITKEIEALHNGFRLVNKNSKNIGGRIFIAKAVILLSMAKKCRDADHLTNLIYDKCVDVKDNVLLGELEKAREDVKDVPEYAFDVHTERGRRNGKTKKDFFKDEFEALNQRTLGLFDEQLKTATR